MTTDEGVESHKRLEKSDREIEKSERGSDFVGMNFFLVRFVE